MTEKALVFVDLTGSTRLYEQLGDQHALNLVQQTFRHFSQSISNHNGELIKTLGDGLFAAFPEAMQAVDACAAMQLQLWLPELSAHHLKIRAGIHWGSVLMDEQGDLFGDAVNVTARLCDFAQPGQLLLSAELKQHLPGSSTLTLRPYPTLQLRGRQQPLDIFEVLNDSEDATVLITTTDLEPFPDAPSLLLHSTERTLRLQAGDSLSFGRATDCDWILSGARVSRHHARIESRHGQFFWIDISTNGSLVHPESNPPQLLNGRSWALEGQGDLWLGGNMESDSCCIHYHRTSSSKH